MDDMAKDNIIAALVLDEYSYRYNYSITNFKTLTVKEDAQQRCKWTETDT